MKVGMAVGVDAFVGVAAGVVVSAGVKVAVGVLVGGAVGLAVSVGVLVAVPNGQESPSRGEQPASNSPLAPMPANLRKSRRDKVTLSPFRIAKIKCGDNSSHSFNDPGLSLQSSGGIYGTPGRAHRAAASW